MPSADRILDMVGAPPADNEVRVNLMNDSLMLTGWTSVRITRSIEVGTSSFEIACTGDANAFKLLGKEGAPIQIFIGQSQVLAGYVDTVEHILTAREHTLTISGRGKCADLIDCSCRIDRINSNTKLLDLCQTITAPYSIDVFVPPNGSQAILDALPVLPRQIVSITETAWEVIERAARYFGMLVFESEAGELVVSTAGTELGASGVRVGVNIEAIVCTKTTLGTYSTYNAVLSAYSAGADDEGIPNMPVYTVVATASRLRPTFFVSEQSAADRRFIEKRTNWMAARAYGRSRRVRVLTDSWRDSDGSIWIPNINYPVSGLEVGIPDGTLLLLAEVTFILDKNGRHAELLFGPRQGFIPEPVALDVLPMDESTQTGVQR
jgi:prophage tail gpP-like protein